MSYILRLTIALLVILLDTTEVDACSVCTVAIMDRILPPIHIWCLIALSWFLLNSLVSSIYKTKIVWTPNFAVGLLLSFVSLILGVGLLGPLFILVLAISPMVAFFSSFSRASKGTWKNNPYYCVRAVGFAASIAITITSYQTYQIYQNRTTGQFIVKWSSSGFAQSLLRGLEEKEPASLNDYRYILEHGRDSELARSAERIVIIGDPESDVKRLEQAIERIKGTSWSYSTIKTLEKSLQDLRARAKKMAEEKLVSPEIEKSKN